MRVLLVPNAEKGRVVEVARSLDQWLVARGHESVFAEDDALADVSAQGLGEGGV